VVYGSVFWGALVSRPATSFKGIYLFLCGICMGAADLVPGISGGTVAFIMGFYNDLLESLKTFKLSSFKLLCSFQFKAFSNAIAWPFLLTLLSGIAFSFITLASFLHWILEHEIHRVYLYSGFLGLILASFTFCVRQLKQWSALNAFGIVVGCVAAYALTSTTLANTEQGSYAIKVVNPSSRLVTNYNSEFGLLTHLSESNLSMMLAKDEITNGTPIYDVAGQQVGVASQFTFKYKPTVLDGWLIFCGAVAVCALLLPGISGSYLLTLLGVYPQAIEALADLTSGVRMGVVDWPSVILLMNLLIGIFFGAICFSRVASWLLRKYPDISLALLSGFMIGALRSVWPFWSYTYALHPLKLHKGAQLIPLEPIWPDMMTWHFALAVLTMILSFAFVLLMEGLKNKAPVKAPVKAQG
jgi:putative membrane protein